MRRRTKPAKGKARAKPSRGAPTRERSRVRDLEKQLTEALTLKTEALRREAEALEQQTAMTEILRVISQSPSDLQPVLDTVVRAAARFCDAPDVILFRAERDVLRQAREVGQPRSTREAAEQGRGAGRGGGGGKGGWPRGTRGSAMPSGLRAGQARPARSSES